MPNDRHRCQLCSHRLRTCRILVRWRVCDSCRSQLRDALARDEASALSRDPGTDRAVERRA